MWATILTWLEGTFLTTFFNWLLSKFQAAEASSSTTATNNQADADQAAADTKKLEGVTDQSSIKDQDDATDDALSHL